MSLKGLLSSFPAMRRFAMAKTNAGRCGWKILEENYPMLMCEKDGYVAIPGGAVMIWDAQNCVMCSLLYHEDRKKYSVMWRLFLTSKAIIRAFQYPRQHLAAIHSNHVQTTYYEQKPDISQVIQSWPIQKINKPVMDFCKKQPCNNCPYRTDAPLQFWDKQEFVNLWKEEKNEQFGKVFGCHKKDGHICIGWLLKQRDRNYPNINLRLQLIRKSVTAEYLESVSSPVPLYPSVESMIKANYSSIIKKTK